MSCQNPLAQKLR